jgi:hypothetical protein
LQLLLTPADGYKIGTVTVINADTSEVVQTITEFEAISGSVKGITLENVSKNLQIKVLFEVNA